MQHTPALPSCSCALPAPRCRGAARGRVRTLVSASSDGDSGPLAGVGAAIELRSRLQRADLARRAEGGTAGWQEVGGAWVRTPPGRAWGVLHFTGGAVLGGFPHLCYDAMLSALSDASGLLVVATPYDLGTDHEAIAQAAAGKLSAALGAVCAREGYALGALPLFGCGHSLGAKLQLLLACGATPGLRYEAQALVAFNNASAADSVKLVEKFARELLRSRASSATGSASADARMFDTLLRSMPAIGAMAERAAAAAGLEFVPNPAETLSRARQRYAPRRCLLLKYDDDELDQNAELLATLQAARPSATAAAAPPDVARRAGNHLSPVVLRLAAEDSPLGAQLGKSVGALRVGDEEAAQELGRDIAAWLSRAT